jgi:hypothetical protein
LDGDLVTPDTFPLPTVGPNVLSRMRDDLHQGKGFAVLRGLDSKKYAVEDLTTIYLGVQAYIANRCGRQDKKGNMLGKKVMVAFMLFSRLTSSQFTSLPTTRPRRRPSTIATRPPPL